ncbi:type II secretion system F family protein [Veronia pacifica]|uniref:MSHA biogenesis protein MshG n=1 Tax=Veronia pacifica TaxID=1080227 RepID=A0A1C3ELM9_9GAMM|nr:type II secretion system F family protein [Veronia pacifica]ODA34147.1 MSHA biogenesis protein MshG [Veronia pacifica]
MAYYQFVAKDQKGGRIRDVVEAESERIAIDKVMERGYILLSLREKRRPTANLRLPRALLPAFSKGISLDLLVIFCRQFYSLSKAGIPLLRAIKGLSQNTSNPKMKLALEGIHEEISNGRALSSAMRDYPAIFSDLFVSLIQVGENTGRLDHALLELSQYYEREIETRRRIKSALRYPSFVLTTIAMAVVFLNVNVIPKFVGMFAKFGSELPLPTRVLIASSNFFVDFWWMLVISAVFGVVAFRLWKESPEGGIKWDKWRLRWPLVGSLLHRALMSRFSRTFSMMIQSGVPLNTALSLAAEAIDNRYLTAKVHEMKAGVESGMTISSVVGRSEVFPSLVHQMIQVGEETGQIDKLLLEVSDFYDREVDYELTTLSARMEPFLLIVVAGLVLLLAMGIFLPMWGMYDLSLGK